ncbi:Diphtheria toxin repressor [Corynebacterium provencense]|uniref:Diphtheria toxin repressor n=1 Tax=Corynebacterium provencense TaxID=1737425 RepID=A0A2Z3YNG8_9CORY|nr:metal-dependent transcriptional regulator [Corynebacterium provencense]AWT26062.1 Diphtheria toxin repressor [Corynebacterium provencense]
MKDLVDTTEMYLRTIFELEEEGIPPLRARIAERLEQSGPTVSQTVARMERDGLLWIADDRSLKLTEEGRAHATSVMRKHRLAERLLLDVIGLPWESVHEEACRWEHVMGDEVEKKLLNVLSDHETSPFGNPVPGLEKIGADSVQNPPNSHRASDLDLSTPTTVRIVSFNEIVQVERKIITRLGQYGIRPGSVVTVQDTPDGLSITSEAGTVTVPDELGHAIRVIVEEGLN